MKQVFYGLLYDVAAPHAHLVVLPINEEYDPACGAPPDSGSLDVERWFHSEPSVISVDWFPGTTCRLRNGYDVLFVDRRLWHAKRRGHSSVPLNRALQRMFSLDWRGNLIVVKRGRYDRGRAMNITPPELSLIHTVVERLVIGLLCCYLLTSSIPDSSSSAL